MNMMKKLRVGVVGIGFIGTAHVEALRRLGFVDVVAIATTSDPKTKADSLCVEAFFTDYKEMIDHCNLDCIHICTPNHTHLPITEYAMDRGIHVVCEKPMNCTVTEAKKMVAKAKETSLVNAINYHNRFYPMTNHMKHIINEGMLGKIFSIHGGYIQDWLLYDTDFSWRLISEKSGSTRALSDIGSHWLDLVEFIIGSKVTKVFADFETVYQTRKKPITPTKTFSDIIDIENAEYENIPVDTEDFLSIIVKFENGATGNAFISQMFAGEKNKITLMIAGTQKSVQWDSNDTNNIIIGNREEGNILLGKSPNLVHAKAADIVSYPGGHVEGFPDAFKQNFKKIYDKILDPNAPVEYATFEDGLHQMILCEKLLESANKRQWVDVYTDIHD